MSSQKTCMFCQRALAGVRAKEHVLKKSWIEALGHTESDVSFTATRGFELVRERQHRATALLAGEVCNVCNNTWMNDIDARVEPILLDLARGEIPVYEIPHSYRFPLARWLLKTACTFAYTDSPERRHIPRHVLDRVPLPNYLPDGFIAFTHGPINTRNIAASSLDAWTLPEGRMQRRFEKMSQRKRMKAAFHYDCVVLGCAWLITPKPPLFLGIADMHFPFHLNKAGYRHMEPEEVATRPALPFGVVERDTNDVQRCLQAIFR